MWKTLFFGSLDCLTVVTDSPQKILFNAVTWFDSQYVHRNMYKAMVEDLIANRHHVFVDCFGELSLSIGKSTFGYGDVMPQSKEDFRSIARQLLYDE